MFDSYARGAADATRDDAAAMRLPDVSANRTWGLPFTRSSRRPHGRTPPDGPFAQSRAATGPAALAASPPSRGPVALAAQPQEHNAPRERRSFSKNGQKRRGRPLRCTARGVAHPHATKGYSNVTNGSLSAKYQTEGKIISAHGQIRRLFVPKRRYKRREPHGVIRAVLRQQPCPESADASTRAHSSRGSP